MKRKIYIAHEYGDESHFKALYEYGDSNGYQIKNQAILSEKVILSKTRKKFLSDGAKEAVVFLVKNLFSLFRIQFVKNEILIAGIAPYNTLLNRYKKLFKRNRSYYFTSHTCWDGTSYSKGTQNNQLKFENILKESFVGAFCVSQRSSDELSRIIRYRSVVNHSINFNLYNKDIENDYDVRRFVFVGAFNDRKNVNLILRWLKKYHAEKIEMSFIGAGEMLDDILELCKTDSRVHYLGYKSKNELQEILCQFDFMILPSKDEPFGIVLLESLAAGVPCVVSNATGPTEIIEDNRTGFIFELDDEDRSFNTKMRECIEMSKDRLVLMKKEALLEGFKYDSSQIIKKWIYFIEQQEG